MRLGALFHYSPADRFEAIRRDGLVPGKPPAIATEPQPFVCLSPDPVQAWTLSGGTGLEVRPTHLWDLWMVRLDEQDEVHVRPTWGGVIEEVQVHNTIPPERVWWVAWRPREKSGWRDHLARGVQTVVTIDGPGSVAAAQGAGFAAGAQYGADWERRRGGGGMRA